MRSVFIKCRIMRQYLVLLLLSLTASALGQTRKIYDLSDLMGKGELEAFNRKVSSGTENSEKIISLSEVPGDGVVWIKNENFSNGTIELDIKGKDVLQQSFVGIAFHGLDEKTLEAVYFRPFNFRSTDSIRHMHAVQYVSHPLYTWDKLRQEQNGKYEKAVNPAPDPNDWFHAKIVVHYPHILVYVNGNEQ